MGYGDELMGSGLARGAHARGKRVAFGDGQRIAWAPQAHEVFKDNPNVAPPGSENDGDLEWIHHVRGHRLYAVLGLRNGRWIFNTFDLRPGEMFLTDEENLAAAKHGHWDVLIEPNVKRQSPNKQWSIERYQDVANYLNSQGYRVAQIGNTLTGAAQLYPATFRHAVAVMRNCHVYVGAEGGLHHAAASVGTRAVVIFGGFIGPEITGYKLHRNLAGTDEPCGKLQRCQHCRAAMDRITVDQVVDATEERLNA